LITIIFSCAGGFNVPVVAAGRQREGKYPLRVVACFAFFVEADDLKKTARNWKRSDDEDC